MVWVPGHRCHGILKQILSGNAETDRDSLPRCRIDILHNAGPDLVAGHLDRPHKPVAGQVYEEVLIMDIESDLGIVIPESFLRLLNFQ